MPGGLKGKSSDGGQLTFGIPGNAYKVLSSMGDGTALRIACYRELSQNELPYPVTDEDAEEYACDEHQVDIPVAEWCKLDHSPLSIGDFLVCRSPEVFRTAISRVTTTPPIKKEEHLLPVALFN